MEENSESSAAFVGSFYELGPWHLRKQQEKIPRAAGKQLDLG